MCVCVCLEDCAYYPREWQQDLQEYILNDSGMLFQGTATSILHRDWMYGQVRAHSSARSHAQSRTNTNPSPPFTMPQFDIGILDACIYILDAAHMPIKNRCDLTAVIRKASAVVRTTSCLHLPLPGPARSSFCSLFDRQSVDPEDGKRLD